MQTVKAVKMLLVKVVLTISPVRNLPSDGMRGLRRPAEGGDGLAGRPGGDSRLRRQLRLHLARVEPDRNFVISYVFLLSRVNQSKNVYFCE